MAINDISQYFTLDNGTQIANDSTFASLAANTRIKNKNSGSTFIKNSNYSNVFDRVSTFTEFIKATDFNIKSSGSGNGVASISYTASTRTVTQTLTAFATPAELTAASNNLKSQAVGSISVSGRTVTYKNINGQTLGSFQTQDNNTTYSAGTGLTLSGTTFSVSQELIDKVLPTGSYIQFAGSQAPAGFLVCNGSAVSRTTYSRLFAVIGTKYGSGNGSTTFNLPNLIDRFLQGSGTSGTVKNAGLPNITGYFNPFGENGDYYYYASGSFYVEESFNQAGWGRSGIDHDNCLYGFAASRSNSIYGNSWTVQPPALTCLICIKY